MLKLHQCADAVEKFWNSGVCRDVLRLVLEKNWYTSAFLMFMDLGKEYAKLKRPYQPYELDVYKRQICYPSTCRYKKFYMLCIINIIIFGYALGKMECIYAYHFRTSILSDIV